METAPPRQLARLQIPPTIGTQQHFILNENAPVFSPSFPTAIPMGMHANFPIPSHQLPMQTPMQPSFFPSQPPGAPARPMHRAHPSVYQLAAAGILPPPGIPMTPLGQAGFPGPMLPPAFVPRSKRTPSVSTGGPPKAVLGGPQRKLSPLPPAAPTAPTPAPQKTRKIVVNLPKETVENGTRETWARAPIPVDEVPEQLIAPLLELTSTEEYPSESWRRDMPPTVDVFLPGKGAWEFIKQKIIEDKLARLGVEKGSGNSVPQIQAPHARAASISSPADPALLFFKLNKLQQSQNVSTTASLSSSPQPPVNMSPSPSSGLPPRFQNRHGHSMSLAQVPQSYNPLAAFNPFGPAATLGSDQIINPAPGELSLPSHGTAPTIHAPQGRIPTNISSLAPPAPLSRPESRPDFARGFGLDATEEVEEPPEEDHMEADEEAREDDEVEDADTSRDDKVDIEDEREDTEEGGGSTAAPSRIHSRHVSKLSAALSLCSVGGVPDESAVLGAPSMSEVPVEEAAEEVEAEDGDGDAVEEWTGSEDMKIDDTDDESIGEWSNPSDEERARQERLQRRMLRRSRQSERERNPEAPRRIPNFPRPPGTYISMVSDNHDDDLISNPSEEGHGADHYLGFDHVNDYSRPGTGHSAGRPLPPLPHSRAGSAQFSHHDPALAHSREASEQYNTPGGLFPRPPVHSHASPLRPDSLNPLAKPFVFGGVSPSSGLPSATTPTHGRVPSFSKPLNIAAPEFKPGGFTFRPPPGVPQLPFEAVAAAIPLSPASPVMPRSPIRASQGREKRQRRGSSVSMRSDDIADIEEGDTMSSFKFPSAPDDIKLLRHSAPASPPANATIHGVSAKPFTLSHLPSGIPFAQDDVAIANSSVRDIKEASHAQATIKANLVQPASADELPFPPTSTKPKRAPIPLDFAHPVSTNTVPAGLFKALINGDGEDRTRRTVRSRLSSRDIFEHSRRPSLDDLAVPTISQRKGGARLFTDPGFRNISPEPIDTFSPRRRSSLPTGHAHDSSMSDMSVVHMGMSRRIEMQRYEQRLEALLDEKMEDIRGALENFRAGPGVHALDPSTESMISEVVSLFRIQLQESAVRSLEDTNNDARGVLDFELLKDIIEESHVEARLQMKRDLIEHLASRESGASFKIFAEELSERTMKAVLSATSQVNSRLQALEQTRPSLIAEREAIVHDILGALAPTLNAIRPEPVDYDGLTTQLTQAVKPHISQLIDLASDKRETASLIVDRLQPLLPALTQSTPHNIDVEGIVGRLTSEIRKIIGPLDAHEIKEQVSDLVVERLDSRLAVRDRAFNVDTVTEKVTESIGTLLTPLKDIQRTVGDLVQKQLEPTPAPVVDVTPLREEITSLLAGLPTQLSAATEALTRAQTEFKVQQDLVDKEDLSSKDFTEIQATIETMAEAQKSHMAQNLELSDFCQDIVKHIELLPEAMVEATKVLQNAHADIIERDTSQKDAEEIRRLLGSVAELQTQLAKARGAHGQVRVEKEHFSERLRAAEEERDRLRNKLDELQASVDEKTTSASAAQSKATELEIALEKASEIAKASEITVQNSHERITSLEKSVQELTNEKQQLASKVDKLEMGTLYAGREKDMLQEEIAQLKKKNEELTAQQSRWDDLQRTSEQITALAALVEQSRDDEIEELKQNRDNLKVLEGEHAALQRRVREYEAKITSNEKNAQAARQTLTQAQQRAVEWERRAKDAEHELDSTRDKLSEMEQTNTQLDADYSLIKMRLDERDTEERTAKDRESKLRDQIADLEGQVARVQAEADQAKKNAQRAPVQAPVAIHQNGYAHSPARPISRTSTIYADSRAATPVRQTNGKSYTPSVRISSPQHSIQSVRDSIHAPQQQLFGSTFAKQSRSREYYRAQAPSPTPSTVSNLTRTVDGWYE